jgi:hypothetical protein
MDGLATGDPIAIGSLAFEFHTPIAAAVRRHLGVQGRLVATEDDIDGLVLEVVLELVDCAHAWDPDGGAQPWVWADRRVGRVVARHLGQWADQLDPDRHEAQVAALVRAFDAADLDLRDVLDRRAAHDPVCGMVRDALVLVGSDRDQAILLEYQALQAAGDPSPAHTVARSFDLEPAAVRQAVRRMRSRLRRLADTDERFADLADLALLAPAA